MDEDAASAILPKKLRGRRSLRFSTRSVASITRTSKVPFVLVVSDTSAADEEEEEGKEGGMPALLKDAPWPRMMVY